ncbi:MAG TPA: acyl-CoA mutase large subunit family protein, partial [Paludibacteraceae bacterium]|nr:acyl-CoA mutase large subunit family protein [Paludibacteraceae bacterium]
MSEKKLNLLADFSPVSTEEWMKKIMEDLKGADFEKKLVWKTDEGFNVQPFYRLENIENLKTTELLPGKFPYVRGTKTDNEWFIRQDIKVENIKEANAKALDILNKGINSLGFDVRGYKISSSLLKDLLENINAECIELNFLVDANNAITLANTLSEYLLSQQYDVKNLQGAIEFDPIGEMLQDGKKKSKEQIVEQLKSVIDAISKLPFYRVMTVNATILKNAGAFITQELGNALAWGNQYLSMMVDAGVDTSLAAKKIKFNFGIGSNYFMEIAKFRAARLLWALIVDAYQPVCSCEDNSNAKDGTCKCATKMRIHAETTNFNKTIFDAHVNMLRTQTEAMSAVLGGIDSLTVLGYDDVFNAPNEFAERIARNQQLLLKEESHFDKVVDPAAGSYYLEILTKEIAQQAWKLFLEIENEGGFLEAIYAGKVQQAIKATANYRMKNISNRKEILVGTNQYPNFNETASEKLVNCPQCDKNNQSTEVETLPPVRGAAEFETLRLATERAAKRPKVFMLTIGNLAMRVARSQFS